MDTLIPPETMTQLLQTGGQFFLPGAALLRALYDGVRGKLPEGFIQILAASFFAGLTAAVNNEAFDLRQVLVDVTGNTVFMAGLLTFILLYLLRLPFRTLILDGVVGGVAGLAAWLLWVQVLLNDWPWWTAPLTVAAGAAAFIGLRFGLRQIRRLVRIATWLLVIGGVVVVIAGGILAFQWITTQGAV